MRHLRAPMCSPLSRSDRLRTSHSCSDERATSRTRMPCWNDMPMANGGFAGRVRTRDVDRLVRLSANQVQYQYFWRTVDSRRQYDPHAGRDVERNGRPRNPSARGRCITHGAVARRRSEERKHDLTAVSVSGEYEIDARL